MQFQCPKCKSILTSDAVTDGMKVTCPACGAQIECYNCEKKSAHHAVFTSDGNVNKDESLPKSIYSKIASAFGIEKLNGFNISFLFANAFSKHSENELEDYFTIGTAKSTPEILDVDPSWPRPWLFPRMMIASLVLYFLLWTGWKICVNTNFLPGLMLVGSFAIPISTLVLFVEMNVRRNMPLYVVARLVFLGGVCSLFITLLFPVTHKLLSLPFSDKSALLKWLVSGPLEEALKVLAMVMAASAAKYSYKLNGLLVGAAVGMGFAAFESAGGALNILLQHGSAKDMVHIVNLCGLLSPFCHIVWSAISGCALWRVVNGRKFKLRMLCDVNFVRLFLLSVVLHMICYSPLRLPYFGTSIILGIASWFVCLSLVQEGLHEIAAEQIIVKKAAENEPASAPVNGER